MLAGRGPISRAGVDGHESKLMVGTPLYMSPEQAGLTSLDIDTRSDIY
jgi:serine/threonine protein kinase